MNDQTNNRRKIRLLMRQIFFVSDTPPRPTYDLPQECLFCVNKFSKNEYAIIENAKCLQRVVLWNHFVLFAILTEKMSRYSLWVDGLYISVIHICLVFIHWCLNSTYSFYLNIDTRVTTSHTEYWQSTAAYYYTRLNSMKLLLKNSKESEYWVFLLYNNHD